MIHNIPTFVPLALSALLVSSPVLAQSTETEDTAEPAVEAPVEAVEEAVEDTVEETPTLEDIADADQNLELVEGEEGEADAMVMLSDVLFDFGSSQLDPAALETLATIGDVIMDYPGTEIVGHTDAIGGEAENLALGLRRAETVRDWILENSEMPAEAIVVSSAGETEPVADNLNEDGTDNPKGRELNRRVVFLFPDS